MVSGGHGAVGKVHCWPFGCATCHGHSEVPRVTHRLSASTCSPSVGGPGLGGSSGWSSASVMRDDLATVTGGDGDAASGWGRVHLVKPEMDETRSAPRGLIPWGAPAACERPPPKVAVGVCGSSRAPRACEGRRRAWKVRGGQRRAEGGKDGHRVAVDGVQGQRRPWKGRGHTCVRMRTLWTPNGEESEPSSIGSSSRSAEAPLWTLRHALA